MRFIDNRLNLKRILIVLVLSLLMAMLEQACADKIGPKMTPYHDIISQSDLVIIGKTLDGDIVQIKDEEGPPPKPIVKVRGISRVKIEPRWSSWRRKDLLDPPKMWAYRAPVEVLVSFKGDVDKNSVVLVDIGYGSLRWNVEEYLKIEYVTRYSAKDSIAIFHLKQLAAEAGKEGEEPRVYKLVNKPWPVKEGELEQATENMKIRLERYRAFQKIEESLKQFDTLNEEELNEFIELISSSKDGMGKPVYPRPVKDTLHRLIGRTKSREAKAREWRELWKHMRYIYVEMPFLLIGNQEEDAVDNPE